MLEEKNCSHKSKLYFLIDRVRALRKSSHIGKTECSFRYASRKGVGY
jgi:hypothetical protein